MGNRQFYFCYREMKRKWTEVRIFFFMTAWVKTRHLYFRDARIHDLLGRSKLRRKSSSLKFDNIKQFSIYFSFFQLFQETVEIKFGQ